jgi:hypothetical protein
LLECPRAGTLDHDVGGNEQIGEARDTRVGSEVERHGSLAGVHGVEPVRRGARPVGATRALDTHHVGPKPRQDERGEWSRPQRREVDDAQPLQPAPRRIAEGAPQHRRSIGHLTDRGTRQPQRRRELDQLAAFARSERHRPTGRHW